MRAEYRFVDQWFVPGASPEEVYDVLGDQLSYPKWWSDVFLDGGTHATLDWRPHVEKPVVKYLTPILRPLFRANHTWAMVRGQRHIIELFERRRDASSVLGASGEGAQPSEQAERA